MTWYTADPQIKRVSGDGTLICDPNASEQYIRIIEPPPIDVLRVQYENRLKIDSDLAPRTLGKTDLEISAAPSDDSHATVSPSFRRIVCDLFKEDQGDYNLNLTLPRNSLVHIVKGTWHINPDMELAEGDCLDLEISGDTRRTSLEHNHDSERPAKVSEATASLSVGSGEIYVSSNRELSKLSIYYCSTHHERHAKLISGNLHCVGFVSPGGALQFDVSESAELNIGVSPDNLWTLSTNCDGILRLHDAKLEVDEIGLARQAGIEFRGRGKVYAEVDIGRASFDSNLTWQYPNSEKVFEYSRNREPFPMLDIAADRAVEHAEGVVTLTNQEGRLYGLKDNPIKIATIEKNKEARHSKNGHLVEVDLNHLATRSLALLDSFAVVEPSTDSLLSFAKGRTRFSCLKARIAEQISGKTVRPFDDPRDDLEPLSYSGLRARAAQLDALLSSLGNRAMSGKRRTALFWAALRLHHRSLPWDSAEKWFRFLLRFLGYGYRPLVALRTWLFVTFGFFLVLGTINVVPWNWIPWTGESFPAILEIALSPLGYLRLGTNQNLDGLDDWLLIVIRLGVGIPFLYFVFGLRHYVRSPLGRGRPE